MNFYFRRNSFQMIQRYILLITITIGAVSGAYSQSGTAHLSQKVAEQLARLPLKCIPQEFPNKTSHTADNAEDAVLLPHQLHPAFYGCFDWHSCVHGHWLLVRLLKLYPDMANKDSIIAALGHTFQKDKMQQEAAYFTKYSVENIYERTYGWAWLLKLDEELATWHNAQAQQWHQALQPLTHQIVQLWKDYLPKEKYPDRTGVHPNTAFALGFALDWARALHDTSFENAVTAKAKLYYLDNTAAPAYLEPDGTDFFSPSLETADLMRRILPREAFIKWIEEFYEPRSIQRICEAPEPGDNTDYRLVHMNGLYFSRAWCMKAIARALPDNMPLKNQFENTAQIFLNKALPGLFSSNYGGQHWLASFALLALE